MPKKYEDLYNAGWDAFTMLGESKEDKDIANSGANLENIVVKVLHDNNINERNAGVFLSKYSGIPFNTFDGLVSFITEAYDYDIEPKNQEMVSIFELYKPQIEKSSSKSCI